MDIILAPYFTKDIGYHQHDSSNNGAGGSQPNDFQQIRKWYEGVHSTDTHAVIFHNELSPDFLITYSTSNISFIEWSTQHRPSYNDERFYAYYDFLIRNKFIEWVLMTDLYDVEIHLNPFTLMRSKPEYALFSGRETMIGEGAEWMRKKCEEMRYPKSRNNFSLRKFLYNAGVIGGTRTAVLKLLKMMLQEFDKIPTKWNANMPVYNYCMEQLEKKYKVFTGHPLHNAFRTNIVLPGTYIKHK